MLDYSTCLKLKEAGFPFKEITDDVCMGVHVGTYITPPTLEELIEACGAGFMSLTRAPSLKEDGEPYWLAGEYKGYATPEEAVANLYLSLNPLKS